MQVVVKVLDKRTMWQLTRAEQANRMVPKWAICVSDTKDGVRKMPRSHRAWVNHWFVVEARPI